MGTAYGAPRLRAADVERLGGAAILAPLRLYAAPTAAHVWRLVVVTGRIDDVHKLGDRWRAELVVGAHGSPIVGQAGAGIPVDRVIEGATATVVGIVRAAYPSASDKRASILPRSPADLQVGRPRHRQAGSDGRRHGLGDGPPAPPRRQPRADDRRPTRPSPDADLADLAAFDGRIVRVGGVVMDLTATASRSTTAPPSARSW